MKIYTKTGDDGTTGLLGSRRTRKDDPRIEAYGTVDELNALLGSVRAHGLRTELEGMLGQSQGDLFVVGSALADPVPGGKFHDVVGPDLASRVEGWIDALEGRLPPLTRFILPGGTPAAAALHVARAVCRRAERQVVALANQPGEHVPEPLIVYLNRLGDFLFVLARVVNLEAGVADVPWAGL